MGAINVGGGRFEMDTDEVRAAMDKLSTAGAAFAAAWTMVEGRIAGNETGIGTNSGAAAFREQYLAFVPVLKESIVNVQPNFERLVTDGRNAVRDYEQIDREYQQRIQRLAGP
jgi:hypothetical protein